MIFIDVVSNGNKPVEVFGDCQSNNSTRGASSSEYDTKNTPGSLLASVVRSVAKGSFIIMKANLALSALIPEFQVDWKTVLALSLGRF